MGVLTTAYSVPPVIMKKIRADHENLAFLLGVEEGGKAWKCATLEFDKRFEEKIIILGENGYTRTREALDLESAAEDAPSFDGYGIRIVPPTTLKTIAKELAPATFEALKAAGLAKGIADHYGKAIPEDDYQTYVGDIEQMKAFFTKAAADGHFLLIAAI